MVSVLSPKKGCAPKPAPWSSLERAVRKEEGVGIDHGVAIAKWSSCLSLTGCRGAQQGTSSRLWEIHMLRSKDMLKTPRDTNRESPVIRCADSHKPWDSHWLALWTKTHQKHTCSFHAICNLSGEASGFLPCMTSAESSEDPVWAGALSFSALRVFMILALE